MVEIVRKFRGVLKDTGKTKNITISDIASQMRSMDDNLVCAVQLLVRFLVLNNRQCLETKLYVFNFRRSSAGR